MYYFIYRITMLMISVPDSFFLMNCCQLRGSHHAKGNGPNDARLSNFGPS